MTNTPASPESVHLAYEPYRLLAQHLPATAVMMFDHDLRFVLADGPELVRNGHSKASLEGRLLHDAVEPSFAALVEPNLRAALGGKRFHDELPFGELTYAYTYEPLRDALGQVQYALVVAQDITPMRRAEREALRSEVRLQSVVSHVPVIVFAVSSDRRITLSDGLGLTRLGRKPGELAGRLVDDVYAGNPLLALVDQAFEGHSVVADVRLGGQIWETRYAPLFDASGAVTEVIGVASDVTAIRQSEASARQTQRLEAVGRLAGGVAHDFNNMLAVIMSAGEEIKAQLPGTPQAVLCGMILAAAERASQLTGQLLTFSRQGASSPQPVNLNLTVDEAATLLARSIDRRVRIHRRLLTPDAVIVADLSRLQSAILNLGLNARDAMPDGGDLTIATDLVDLDDRAGAELAPVLAPGRYGQITVSDTGVGIPPEIIGRIFDPFFTTKAIGLGTGLGLAAVYGTAVSHGGAVTVTSEPGTGTTFRLLLPLASEPLVDPAELAEVTGLGQGLILLVEDEPLVQHTAHQLLNSLGYTVVTADDGRDGLERFREHHERLAAVVCDGIMPRLSGRDATRAMRALDPAVPIILCTGFAPDEPQMGGAGEYDALLPKPYRRHQLADTLARTARVV